MSTMKRPLTGTALLAGLALLTACGAAAPATAPAAAAPGPATSAVSRSTAVPATAVPATAVPSADPPSAAAAVASEAAVVAVTATDDAVVGTTKACSLVTAQDLRPLGKVVSHHATEDAKRGLSWCSYVGTSFLYTIYVVDPGRGKAFLDAARAHVPAAMAAQLVDVPGIGDDALGVFSPKYCGLLFYRGDATVSTYLIVRPSTAGRNVVIALAKTAASRL